MAAPRPALSPGRRMWVVAHRWAGLTIALFLTVAGLTGALLPWERELELAARPSLAAVHPAPGVPVLDGVALAERVERQTDGRVGFLPLEAEPGKVAILRVAAPPGARPIGYDTVWADPYTGAVRLTYRYAALSDGPQTIIPFLYRVHYSLALGPLAQTAFGVAALLWTLDCFVGVYLTLPLRRRPAGGPAGPTGGGPPRVEPSWWARWRPAWTVRRHARGHKLNFDLHRAGGLWLWPVLLVFAWSSVGFNLPTVHRPVMKVMGATDRFTPRPLPHPLMDPPVPRRDAVAQGAALLAEQGRAKSFSVERGVALFYAPAAGAYAYYARTARDVVDKGGRTRVWFSAVDGRLLAYEPPLGRSGADGFSEWLFMLHMAQVFGLPYRVFVSALGLAVAALSVTGVLIWMRKRSARLLSRPRAAVKRAERGRVAQPA